MRILPNSGTDRVVEALRQHLRPDTTLSVATPDFSLFAFGELQKLLARLTRVQLSLPTDTESVTLNLLGTAADRPQRNRLQGRWLAQQCADWLEQKGEVRYSATQMPQAALLVEGVNPAATSPAAGLTSPRWPRGRIIRCAMK